MKVQFDTIPSDSTTLDADPGGKGRKDTVSSPKVVWDGSSLAEPGQDSSESMLGPFFDMSSHHYLHHHCPN